MDPHKDGPLYFRKPGWASRYCPFSKTQCLKEGCVAFQFEQPSVGRPRGWYGDQPETMNITCKALGIVFEIWDAAHVQEHMDEMMEGMENDGGEEKA